MSTTMYGEIASLDRPVTDKIGNLHYKLIKTKAVTLNNDNYDDVYSILCLISDTNGDVEYEFAYDITRDERTAFELMRIIYKNRVTPCSIKYVLQDIL